MSEEFGAIDDAWAGSAEITGIHDENAILADGGEVVETGLLGEPTGALHRLTATIPAGHEDDDFRLSFDDLVPREANGVLPFAAEDFDAARDFDLLGNPMTGAEKRVNPFRAKDARTRQAFDGMSDASEAGGHLDDEPIRFRLPIGGAGDGKDVRLDIGERNGEHPDNVGFIRERFQGAKDFVLGGGANLAEVLGENECGREIAEELFIDLVEALPCFEACGNGSVDLAAGHFLDRNGATERTGLEAIWSDG